MPLRQLVDAGAQSTVSGAITAVQTSVTLQSASGFPGILAGGQLSVIILDSGNPAYSVASPLATPFEYQPVNAIAGNVLTFGTGGGGALRAAYAGTTPHAYFAGATVAAVMLAEDFVASSPWAFDTQTPSGVASITIPASGTIPASYLGINWRHIEIQWYGRSTSGNTNDLLNMRFNGDVGATYDFENATFTTALVAAAFSNQTSARVGVVAGGAASAALFNSGSINIQNFTVATIRRAYQASCWRNDSTIAPELDWGAWQNITQAITSITLFPAAGNWAAGSIVSTYLKP